MDIWNMDAWTFTHPGTWTRTEAPEWPDGPSTDDYMAQLGYTEDSKAWNPTEVQTVGCWTLYTATNPRAACRYLLLVDDSRRSVTLVFVPTFPDLLAYLATYGEIGQTEGREVAWDGMRDTLEKAFQIWHGHASLTSCPQCDTNAARHAPWLGDRSQWRGIPLAVRRINP